LIEPRYAQPKQKDPKDGEKGSSHLHQDSKTQGNFGSLVFLI